MKISVKSKSLVNIILFLLYMESCYCVVRIDRDSPDISDLVDINNCNSIQKSNIEKGRCKCSIGVASSIVSTNTGQLSCVANGNIDSSKYTWMFYYPVLFPLRKIVTGHIILVYAGLFMTEHLIPAVTFHERKFYGVMFNEMGLLYSLSILVWNDITSEYFETELFLNGFSIFLNKKLTVVLLLNYNKVKLYNQ